MPLKVEKTPLADLLLLQPTKYPDESGHLVETHQSDKYAQAGITCDFIQDNQSYSLKGVLRGLHAQFKHPQAKLVRVASGVIFDVAVDARPDSKTFGKWHADLLSGMDHRQLFIPAGFLHGFVVLSDSAFVHYCCSDYYDLAGSFGVMWNDPDLGIDWPIKNPVMSEKDMKNLSWREAMKLLDK